MEEPWFLGTLASRHRQRVYPGPLTPLRNPPRCPVNPTSSTATASIGRRYVGKDAAGWRRTRQWIEHTSQTFEFLSLDCPLTRCKNGRHAMTRPDRRAQQDEKGRRGQFPVLRPLRKIVERDGRDKQRNRKMNQHDMLRVLRENHSSDVEGIHAHVPLTSPQPCRSSLGELNRSRERFPAC